MSLHPDVHAERRARMVDELRLQNIASDPVLDALGRVPRERFVPEGLVERAYENRALPIGEGQTISQPLVVAMMTEALALGGTENVLEVGTGSGYQAAVLAELARTVHTIERSAKLHAAARERLERLGYRNVTCHLGDGTQGLPEEAPFDAICVTAGSPTIPQPLRDQLAPAGRLVIPVGQRKQQALRCITRSPGGEISEDVTHVVFVPLVGEHGWPEEPEKRDD